MAKTRAGAEMRTSQIRDMLALREPMCQGAVSASPSLRIGGIFDSAPVSDRRVSQKGLQMDIDHLDGGELLESAPRGQSQRQPCPSESRLRTRSGG
jgi:hypothetical protein